MSPKFDPSFFIGNKVSVGAKFARPDLKSRGNTSSAAERVQSASLSGLNI